jgi:hypothetical protein
LLKIPLWEGGILSILFNTLDLFDMVFLTKPVSVYAVLKSIKRIAILLSSIPLSVDWVLFLSQMQI